MGSWFYTRGGLHTPFEESAFVQLGPCLRVPIHRCFPGFSKDETLLVTSKNVDSSVVTMNAYGSNRKLVFQAGQGVEHSYPMVYSRRSGDERYVVVLNPSNKSVETTIASQGAKRATYFFGTTKTATDKIGRSMDSVQLPPLSAAIFKVE